MTVMIAGAAAFVAGVIMGPPKDCPESRLWMVAGVLLMVGSHFLEWQGL